jgi:sortase A
LVAGLALTAAGGVLLGQQAWLLAKATLAERWVEQAFEAHLDDGEVHLPWGWADTWPVACLEVPRLAVRRVVLAGASGSTLAFGPGHVDGTALPNRPGNCAVAGHRDGSFAFLRELEPGDRVVLTTRGEVRDYTVDETTVRSMWDVEVMEPTARRTLTLITCYPFDGSPGSPWRYVVTARSVERAPDGPRVRWRDLAAGRSPGGRDADLGDPPY